MARSALRLKGQRLLPGAFGNNPISSYGEGHGHSCDQTEQPPVPNEPSDPRQNGRSGRVEQGNGQIGHQRPVLRSHVLQN